MTTEDRLAELETAQIVADQKLADLEQLIRTTIRRLNEIESPAPFSAAYVPLRVQWVQ